MKCVRAGSARSATKQRTEAYLQPTAKLLQYANSPQREKQSILMRDLKLGINHIDREQLRRNGLLSPRYPTILLVMKATVEDFTMANDGGGLMNGTTLYKIRCVAAVCISDEVVDEDELAPYKQHDGTLPNLFREEWVVYRSFKDFQTLHKHLKTQVASTEQSASAGARLVGAATAAFTVGGSTGGTGGNRRRKGLIPSLGQANKAGALGVTKKSIQKRMGVLNAYLSYLLSDTNLLSRCNELLAFLGAFYPLPPEVRTGGDPVNSKLDALGRFVMKRTALEEKSKPTEGVQKESKATERSASEDRVEGNTQTEAVTEPSVENPTTQPKEIHAESARSAVSEGVEEDEDTATNKNRVKEIDMIPSIKAKIDEVPLAQVRNALFELVRYQFDFDNASFFRNRMFATLKTMSFALASSGEFRKMLYDSHTEYVSSDAIAEWIKLGVDTIFPNGMFMEYSTPLTPEEKQSLAQRAKDELPKAFPDQLRSVLGQDIVQGGLDILHEMLQNRVVLKSMFYMMFDMLWLEAFPELQDFLTGSAALEAD